MSSLVSLLPLQIAIRSIASGTIVETADYYPYGATTLDNATGTPQQRKYIGQQYDGT
jgi:hypothetical protein